MDTTAMRRPASIARPRLDDLAAPKPDVPARARRTAEARKSSGRRRQVDPATCEREDKTDEWEFMQAMQEYKQSSGRMFPTWSETLEVLHALGYQKKA